MIPFFTGELQVVWAVPGGFALGLVYFGALWLTVRQLPHSRYPTLLLLGSGLARLGLATVGFYLLFGGSWVKLGLALLGFVLARMVLIARWQPQDSGLDLVPNTLKDSLSNDRSGEVSHEH